jgi:hypothetical protein
LDSLRQQFSRFHAVEVRYLSMEVYMGILLLIALLLLIFGVIGGIAISKFLFLVLIVALIVGAIGFFTRSTA